MKLMWFHLMPYTELPEDFNKKHPSVWVDIHSSLFDPKRAHHMYNDFMDELEYAADCGSRRAGGAVALGAASRRPGGGDAVGTGASGRTSGRAAARPRRPAVADGFAAGETFASAVVLIR